MPYGGTRAAVTAAAVAVIMSAALSGCVSGAPTGPATTHVAEPTSTPSATPSDSAVPTPEAETNAQLAWKACEAVAQEQYVSTHPGASIEPFSASRDTFQDFGDGSPRMMVGVSPAEPVDGSGGIVVICTMADTGSSPTVVSWTMKDV
jgi:hypothetical protein